MLNSAGTFATMLRAATSDANRFPARLQTPAALAAALAVAAQRQLQTALRGCPPMVDGTTAMAAPLIPTAAAPAAIRPDIAVKSQPSHESPDGCIAGSH